MNNEEHNSKKKERQRIAVYVLVLFVITITFVLVATTRNLQKTQTTTSLAYQTALRARQSHSTTQTSLNPNTISNQISQGSSQSGDSQTGSKPELAGACKVVDLRFFEFKHAFGGKNCWASASFTCVGGPKDGRTYRGVRPNLQIEGQCLTEEQWAAKANSICGCSITTGSQYNPLCRVRAVEYVDLVNHQSVSCSRTGGSTCFYEAQVTCPDYKKYNLSKSLCSEQKDWDTDADKLCCKGYNDDGTYKPPCGAEFPFEEYSFCAAYCKQRGYDCVAGVDRGLTCNIPPGVCIP